MEARKSNAHTWECPKIDALEHALNRRVAQMLDKRWFELSSRRCGMRDGGMLVDGMTVFFDGTTTGLQAPPAPQMRGRSVGLCQGQGQGQSQTRRQDNAATEGTVPLRLGLTDSDSRSVSIATLSLLYSCS